MKKLLGTLSAALLLLSTCAAAYADVLLPGQERVAPKPSVWIFVVIGAAVIAAAAIIWRMRRK